MIQKKQLLQFKCKNTNKKQFHKFILCWLPFATDRRHNSTLFFQFCKDLVHLLTISVQNLGYISCGDGLASFTHGIQNFFFHGFCFYKATSKIGIFSHWMRTNNVTEVSKS